jgi:hypothetical protein
MNLIHTALNIIFVSNQPTPHPSSLNVAYLLQETNNLQSGQLVTHNKDKGCDSPTERKKLPLYTWTRREIENIVKQLMIYTIRTLGKSSV